VGEPWVPHVRARTTGWPSKRARPTSGRLGPVRAVRFSHGNGLRRPLESHARLLRNRRGGRVGRTNMRPRSSSGATRNGRTFAGSLRGGASASSTTGPIPAPTVRRCCVRHAFGVVEPTRGRSVAGPATVHLVVPRSFNDAQQIADKFKGIDSGHPQPAELRRRSVETADRLSRAASTYALDGGMQRVADKVFLLTPRNVE